MRTRKSGAPEGPLPRRARGLRGVALSAVSLLLFLAVLLAAEGAVRLWGPARPQAYDAAFVQRSLAYLSPCFERTIRAGAVQLVTSGAESTAQEFPFARSPGVARIAIVGESSAQRLGASMLQELEPSACQPRFELLECAQSGSSIEHVERRFEEVMTASPDVVFVAFEHNVPLVYPMSAWRLRLRQLRAHSRLLSLLAGPVDAHAVEGSDPRRRLALYERFLHRAAGVARARGVRLIPVALAANLWIPPVTTPASVQSEDLLDARYVEATEGAARAAALMLEREGRPLSAMPHDALWDFERGVMQARAGDADGARQSLQRALERDDARARAPREVDETLRRVAAAERLTLYDMRRRLEAGAPQGLPGWETYVDHVHPRRDVTGREAAALFEMGRSRLGPAAGECRLALAEIGATSQPDLYAWMATMSAAGTAFLVSPWYRSIALMTERQLNDAGEAGWRSVEDYLRGHPAAPPPILVELAEGCWRAGRTSEALALNERARAAGSAAAWVQRGMFHLRGRELAEARTAFERARALEAGRADVDRFLARLNHPSLPDETSRR